MNSKHGDKDFGAFVRTSGKFYNDEEQDKGESEFHLRIVCLPKIIDSCTYVSFAILTL